MLAADVLPKRADVEAALTGNGRQRRLRAY